MPDVAFCDGGFIPVEQAKVSIDDRGFLFGDSVYEVIAAYNGRPFMLDEHLARLRRSLSAIRMHFDVDGFGLVAKIHEGIGRCGYQDVVVYVQITRGVAPRAHCPPEGLSPNVVMTFKQLSRIPRRHRENGVAVMTTPEIRWANCSIKATTLLPNVLACIDARESGFFDAVFVTKQGEVHECTHSNIVAVRDGRLHFPARDESVLRGITLECLERCAADVGVEVVEGALSVEQLRSADEVFLSNTAFKILPVVRIDDHTIGDGSVGPTTVMMYDVLCHRIEAEAICESPRSSVNPVDAPGRPRLVLR